MSGPQCCENPPTLSSSSGTGVVENVGGFSTYISAASPDSKLGIILASDVFGYEAPNLRGPLSLSIHDGGPVPFPGDRAILKLFSSELSPNRSKRKMPLKFECGNPSSIQMVKPLHLSKSKRKKLRLMEKKNSVSSSGMIHGDVPVCVSICENDDGIVDRSSPLAIEVEKNTSSANNPSPVLNASMSPVVSVAVSPVALVDSQSCIPMLTYNLRPRRKVGCAGCV